MGLWRMLLVRPFWLKRSVFQSFLIGFRAWESNCIFVSEKARSEVGAFGCLGLRVRGLPREPNTPVERPESAKESGFIVMQGVWACPVV